MINNQPRTLSGQTEINADILVLPNNINALTIDNNKGLAGQVLAKNHLTNKLEWDYVDDITIPDGSITGAKLATDIDIDTTGDIIADNITARTLLKAETTLEIPNSISAISIGGGIGEGLAGQVLAKNNITNKLEWDFVDDITIEDRSINHIKLEEKTITEAEIADNAIITRTINNGAITTEKINDEAITTAKIEDEAITTSKIEDEAITTDKIEDGAITNDKIADTTIAGGKLASDININTTGNISGAVITATDHFVQTTSNGAVENTFTGGITTISLNAGAGLIQTTGNIQGEDITASGDIEGTDITATGDIEGTDITASGDIEGTNITATNRYIQTGTSTNSFSGALSTSKSYLQTDHTQLNNFDGPLHLTLAGNGTPPTTLGEGGYALQVGSGSVNADVYIKRNLVVDGTIIGDIQGDITDTHIDAQSLTLEDKGDASGLKGLRIKDNFDLLMVNSANSTTTFIDGSTGDINAFRHINLTTASSQLIGDKTPATGSSFEVNTPQKNFDFSSETNTNLAGRTWTKIWAPPRQTGGGLTGSQVNYKFAGLKTNNQWYSVGAYSNMTNFTGRLTGLDITIKPRTTRVWATLTMSCACNHQFGMRLALTSGPSTPSFSSGYLQLGDDWSNDDFLSRGRWTWDFYLSGLTKDATYVLHPEVYVPYFKRSDGLAVAIQFWVGNLAGSSAPAENQEADGPAILRVNELPEEDVEVSMFQEDTTTAGPYPTANVNQLQSYWSDEPESEEESEDDY